MAYILKANITIDSRRPDSPSNQDLLKHRQEELMHVLSSLQVSCDSDFYYYHPEEEAEVTATDYVALNLSLTRKCKKFRSLVHIAQIILSLTSLFDDTFGVVYRCTIADPILVDHDDEDT